MMQHTVKAFDADIGELRALIAQMGGLAEQAIGDAMTALRRHDLETADRVVAGDKQIDVLQMEVERLAVRLIALRAPMADDLREVVAALKIAGVVERIGDYAKNIAKRIVLIEDHGDIEPLSVLPAMARLAIAMVHDVLDAFAARDADAARQVCQRDRALDIELMKRLSPRVNVVPVIGKADSLTPAELAESKKLVMEDIEHYRIPVYNFPYDIEEDDEDTVEENSELRGLMPFAIVGSDEVIEIGGRRVRARQYPWGVVEIDNPRHSDFLAIRSALLHSHLADLKEITHDFLYENYRTEKLSKSVEGGAAQYVHTISNLPSLFPIESDLAY